MAKCDKYIRLVTSVIKTYRAFNPDTRLVKVYKELIIARRVIRWEGKYENVMDLRRGKDSFGTKLFKIEQIVGDIVDESALWLTIYFKGTNKNETLIKKL
jgi:hypothetical protein